MWAWGQCLLIKAKYELNLNCGRMIFQLHKIAKPKGRIVCIEKTRCSSCDFMGFANGIEHILLAVVSLALHLSLNKVLSKNIKMMSR